MADPNGPRSTLTVWPLESLTRVFPDQTPPRAASARAAGWELVAAGGEYITFQLGVLTDAPLAKIEAEVTALRKGGTELACEPRVRWVWLVPVPHDAFDVPGAERPDDVPGWYPDPLLPQAPWSGASPARAAALHVTLHVDRKAAAGVYRAKVVVKRDGKVRERIPLALRVWPFSLPKKPTFYVTNWFQLDCVTKWHRCAPWSARHWNLLDAYAREMAEHRQNVVTTPTFIGNFHNSDPMALVDATLRKDGTYTFAGVVLILGFANLIADGLSMTIGDFLSAKAGNEYNEAERTREQWEVGHCPEGERAELVELCTPISQELTFLIGSGASPRHENPN